MKNIFMFSMVLAAALAVAGCCSMCKQHASGGGKCPSCGMPAKQSCPQCGMSKGQCKCPATAAPMAEINTLVLKSLIDSGVKLTLVDARVGKYDDGRRIPYAINLGPEAKDSEIQSALTSKDALIVSYCVNLKCPASRLLAARLIALGYKHVLEYPQGIEGWVSAGYPVTQATK